jgi:hypothetical protein
MSILQVLSSYDLRLYAAWKGESDDDRPFFAYLNGTAWEAQAPALRWRRWGTHSLPSGRPRPATPASWLAWT